MVGSNRTRLTVNCIDVSRAASTLDRLGQRKHGNIAAIDHTLAAAHTIGKMCVNITNWLVWRNGNYSSAIRHLNNASGQIASHTAHNGPAELPIKSNKSDLLFRQRYTILYHRATIRVQHFSHRIALLSTGHTVITRNLTAIRV